ncbi:hypothetical protein PR202_ga20834 [Eleusine coracana subsp. coracana]|uniref:Peptidase A1 domain-containing protein n=1 Tax=Eleusine coracana subsp. coracana TaxID=191504 RepID=A0AAV5CZC3_ELECO|nr:hypothetical protein QOZ80_8AG0628790 [Eleusine coracana subsp. coracana]GJN03394.1 hypothetical protein PR202_ga20834 [Eleusine coracana subsp. coracana]
MARNVHPLVLCLAVVVTAAPAHAIFHFDFRTDMVSPFDGGYSRHDVWRRAALASNARVAKHVASHGKALGKKGKEISEADAATAVGGMEGQWMTVSIGTPPQPAKLVLDTSSPLIWTQCNLFEGPKAKQVEPIIDPAKSTTFQVVPCGDELCRGGQFTNCTDNKCMYSCLYANLVSEGDTFTFGAEHNVAVPFGFGCGTLAGDGLAGASGIMSLSWSKLSLITQLSIPRFSYCFTPFTLGKKSPLLFGTTANLQKYKSTGPIQSMPLIKNPWNDVYYYVPMVGISVGTKKLDVPVESLVLNPDGSGGTVIDSGSTLSYLVKPAFEELKKRVMEAVKLPVAKHAVKEYQLCFKLPADMSLEMVEVPPLRLHFEGGAEMVLPRDNYFQEPMPGQMCLAIGQTPMPFFPNMISNVLQQNMHVLFDVRNSKLFFAPTECEKL